MRKIFYTIFILILLVFSSKLLYSFSFEGKLKKEIRLKYSGNNIEANFILNKQTKRNNFCYLCGKINYILKNGYEKNIDKRCKSSTDFCVQKDFYLYMDEQKYNIQMDSIASVFKPWQFFNSNNIEVYKSAKICFIMNECIKYNEMDYNSFKIVFEDKK